MIRRRLLLKVYTGLFVCSLVLLLQPVEYRSRYVVFPGEEFREVIDVRAPFTRVWVERGGPVSLNVSFVNLPGNTTSPVLSDRVVEHEVEFRTESRGFYVFSFAGLGDVITKLVIDQVGWSPLNLLVPVLLAVPSVLRAVRRS